MNDSKVVIDMTEFDKKLAQYINEKAEVIAKKIAVDARASVKARRQSTDSDSILANRIKAKKSKFDEGGWIVKSEAPHSWLNEFGGHAERFPTEKKYLKFEINGKTIFTKKVKKMPAKPFLRPALDANIAFAKKEFEAK